MPTNHRRGLLAVAAVAATLAATTVFLRRFPPADSSFYPVCPFHQFTGLLCPGCGATRALAALTHAHLAEALHWNALVVAGFVISLLYVGFALGCVLRNRSCNPPSPRMITASLVITAAFTFWRNLV